MILVTGGTGTLGRLVVPQLRDGGKVRVLSRRRREAADGVEYVTARSCRPGRPGTGSQA